jgi:glycyl-tRNA synthetase beta chain
LGKDANVPSEVVNHARRAAHLAKADLTTHLVYEFPELQGFAGAEYAKLEGEIESVSKAISGHYLPANLSEDYQDLKKHLNLEGALVGLCDRLDLLVGATGLGIELSGSQDPYALRRAAGCIVKILRAHPMKFSLSKWIRVASEQFGKLISKPSEEIARQLIPIFKERIVFELGLKAGSKPYEVLQGIFASGFDFIREVYDKFEHLSKELKHESFTQACKVMERTGNIFKGVKEKVKDQIEPELFQEELEKALYRLVQAEEASIQKLVQGGEYGAAVKHYGHVFYQPVHDFFDRVLVNIEDLNVRANRQALVKKVNLLCKNEIADLSYVTNS